MVDVLNPILRYRRRGNASLVLRLCNATGLTRPLLRGLSPTFSIASVPSFHSGQVWKGGLNGLLTFFLENLAFGYRSVPFFTGNRMGIHRGEWGQR